MSERELLRARLRGLNDEQLRSLINAVPDLARVWARLAKCQTAVLLNDNRRARGTVRKIISTRTDLALDALAAAGFYGFLNPASDSIGRTPAETVDGESEGEIPAGGSLADLPAIARSAGRHLEPALSSLLLRAILSSPLAIVATATDDLPLLIEEAERAWLALTEQENGKGADAYASGTTALGSAPEALPIERLLLHIKSHVAASGKVAAHLEDAASAVRGGRPFAALGELVDPWLETTRSLLEAAARHTDASTLDIAVRGLESKIAERDVEASRLSELRAAIDSLLSQGFTDPAETLARSNGFASAAQLVSGAARAAPLVSVDGQPISVAPAAIEEVGASADAVEPRATTDEAPDPADGIAELPPQNDDWDPSLGELTEASPPSPAAKTADDDAEVEVAGAPVVLEITQDDEVQEDYGRRNEGSDGPLPPDAVASGTSSASPTPTSVQDGELDAALSADAASPPGPQSAQQGLTAAEVTTHQRTSFAGSSVSRVDDHSDCVGQVAATAVAPAQDLTGAGLWSDGAPSVIARLLLAGREASAAVVAEAAGEASGRVRLLQQITAAAWCSRQVLEESLTGLTPSSGELETFTSDDYRVYVAATAWASLRLGYLPLPLDDLMLRGGLKDSAFEPLIEAISLAASSGYRHAGGLGDSAEREAPPDAWDTIRESAIDLSESLRTRTIRYARATTVLKHLVRDEEPVGAALSALVAVSSDPHGASDKWLAVERAARALSGRARRDRIIRLSDAAVSSGSRLNQPIEGPALMKLREPLERVSELVEQALAARQRLAVPGALSNGETEGALRRAVELIELIDAPPTVGDAALRRFVDWLRTPAVVETSASVQNLLDDVLLGIPEIPRDRTQTPERPLWPTEIAAVVEPAPASVVVEGYLQVGNLEQARAFALRSGVEPSDSLDDAILRAKRAAAVRLRGLVERVENLVAQLLALDPDGPVGLYVSRLEASRLIIADRYDLSIEPLRVLADEVAVSVNEAQETLRRRIEHSETSLENRRRIEELVGRDPTLAQHFLELVELGEPLPAADDDVDGDLTAFFPGVVNAAAGGGRDAVEAAIASLTDAPVTNERLRRGIRAWRELTANRRRNEMDFRVAVADALRMVGLNPAPSEWLRPLVKTHKTGHAAFRVTAVPVDDGFVPELGSQATSFDLTVVWDPVSPTRLLEFIGDTGKTRANVIFYLADVLTTKQRADLRRITRAQSFSPVVIDAAVIGWLATREEPSWRVTQKVTLPFATANPYKPYSGGEVPPEVFVGRAAEQRDVIDPFGPMFVYGGRQLGKSALLRRVERVFTEPVASDARGRTGRVAVYIDLKAAGVQSPDQLWPLLADRLRAAKVLPPGTASKQDTVSSQIRAWAREDDTNELLLLLDEADTFLSTDAEEVEGAAFRVLEALKEIMENTGRRVRPVFAGLHKVQRFYNIPNTAVVHGGSEILIGPLDSANARRLVVKPLEALGYRFESPELVWRLLLFSNYIASFLQIVLRTLVDNLDARPIPETGGPAVITAVDVDRVCSDRDVRAQLAERFRWTIRLDNRYLVIALVTALRSLDDDGATAFIDEELREECAVYWPQGFSEQAISEREFGAYLDEMVGLGVLQRLKQPDRTQAQYTLRSRNVVSMLGTPEALGRELYEAARSLELEYEYNPGLTRAVLDKSGALSARRAPLSDDDVRRLLDRPSDGSSIGIVVGSSALGVGDVAVTLRDAGTMRDLAVETVSMANVVSVIESSPAKHLHVVVDLSSEDQPLSVAFVEELAATLSRRRLASATIIVGPKHLPLPASLLNDQHIVIALRRWTMAGLQAWRDSPFNTPELRQRLHRVTGGWPRLVERAMSAFEQCGQTLPALEVVAAIPDGPGEAEQMLRDSGVDLEVARTLGTWFVRKADDGLTEGMAATTADVAEALGRDSIDVLEHLRLLDVITDIDSQWVLDRVIATAAGVLAGQ